MLALVPVWSSGPSVQGPLVPVRYCRSYSEIAGRPVFDGAVQVTSRLVVLPEVAVTVGAAGASGVSVVVLVTVMVTAIVSEPPLRSLTLSVTV